MQREDCIELQVQSFTNRKIPVVGVKVANMLKKTKQNLSGGSSYNSWIRSFGNVGSRSLPNKAKIYNYR